MQIEPSTSCLAEPLAVGDVVLPNRVFLAPMSGVSDRPFRELALRLGAGGVVSEMIAGDQLAHGRPVAMMKAERAGTGPHIVQLVGREAKWMGEGARAATDAGADIIDINMGCPSRKVINGYSGSALMRNLDHAVALIDATIAATDRPVTLKMRLGWDDQSINAPELARRAEAAGVRLLTVHGRTRNQFFKGEANWRAIRDVKAAVSIPVIANGDLRSTKDLASLMKQSGADGVMIGRGAYGRPWLPGQLVEFAATGRAGAAPAGADWSGLVAGHYRAILQHYGEPVGVRAARKHLGWYLDRGAAAGIGIPAEHRRALLTAVRPKTVLELVGALTNRMDVALAS